MNIPVDKLKAVRHVVTHANCPDGVASAMILRSALGPTVKFTFLDYETQAHRELPAETGMLFCDFTPHRSRVQEFVDAGAIVLDHHKTQRDIAEAFGELGVYADNDGRSGASLAHEVWAAMGFSRYQLVGSAVGKLARLAAIRDTWQRSDREWQRACDQASALVFWPAEELLRTTPDEWDRKLEIGPALYRKHRDAAQRALDSGVSFTTAGGTVAPSALAVAANIKVIVFQGVDLTSDAAELDDGKHHMVVGFGYSNEPGAQSPRVTFSLRSHTGYDVGAFAKFFGGGGHAAAAGFSQPVDELSPNPYQDIRLAFGAFELMGRVWA